MTLSEFVAQYKNRKVDYDLVYGAQCVDLFRQYCHQVLRIPHTGSVDGAKDLFLNYEYMPLEKKYFDCIPYDSENADIRPGDVIVWNETATNRYGHVAIVISTLENAVVVFEQNGFVQDGAKLFTRSLNNVLGVLRLKVVQK